MNYQLKGLLDKESWKQEEPRQMNEWIAKKKKWSGVLAKDRGGQGRYTATVERGGVRTETERGR